MRKLLLLALALTVVTGCEKEKKLALEDPNLKPAKEVAATAPKEPANTQPDLSKLATYDIEVYPGATFDGEPVWKISTASPDDPAKTIDSYTSRMNTTDPPEKVIKFYEKEYVITSKIDGGGGATLFGKNRLGDIVVTITKTDKGSTANVVVSTGNDLDTSRKRDIPVSTTTTG